MSKVSIIMPAYNAERYITEAIQSVIAQTFTDWELIVIDDASQDSTVEIVQKFSAQNSRILLYRNMQNSGVSATRNRGLDMAIGEYVAFLDSDDIWASDKLEKQIYALLAENAQICYSSYSFIDLSGNSIRIPYIVDKETSYKKLLKENVIGCSTVILSRKFLGSARFDKGYFHEDYVLWLRLLKDGHTKAIGISDVLVQYRNGGRSSNKIVAVKNRWIVYRKSEKLNIFQSTKYLIAYATNAIIKHL